MATGTDETATPKTLQNKEIHTMTEIEIEETISEFTIPAYRREAFQKKIDQANSRLLRGGATGREFVAGYEPFSAEKIVGGVELPDGTTFGGTRVTEPWYRVTLAGFRLTLGDYTFVASLVGEEAGYTVHCAPGQSLDGWKRPAVDDVHCDHCGIKRNRKRLYIIRDDNTGQLLQVGHSCIELYTGLSPKGLWALQFDQELKGFADEDRGGNGGAGSYGIPVDKVLGYAYSFSDEGRSYVSTKAAEWGTRVATGRMVGTWIVEPPRAPQRSWYRDGRDYAAALASWEENLAKAQRGDEYSKDESLIADIKAVAETLKAGTDYADNMTTILAGEHVSGRNVGILASLVSVYAREKDLAVKRAAAVPMAKGYLAPVKTRIKSELRVKLTTVRFWEGDFGTTTFMVGTTPDMHCVVWKASGRHEVETGDTLVLSAATVKAHETFGDKNPIDQTVITRAVIKEVISD
jgi:hypothetical protein